MIGALLAWCIGLGVIVIFACIVVDYLPDSVKKWIKNKFFKEAKKK